MYDGNLDVGDILRFQATRPVPENLTFVPKVKLRKRGEREEKYLDINGF